MAPRGSSFTITHLQRRRATPSDPTKCAVEKLYPSLSTGFRLEVNKLHTVSLGKDFGFKGKQHHKHTASETQSHTQ